MTNLISAITVEITPQLISSKEDPLVAKNDRVRAICKRAREDALNRALQVTIAPIMRTIGPIEKWVQYFLSLSSSQFYQIHDNFKLWGNVVRLSNQRIVTLNKAAEEAIMLVVRQRGQSNEQPPKCVQLAQTYDAIDWQNARDPKVARRVTLTDALHPLFVPRESLMRFYLTMDDDRFRRIYKNQILEGNATDNEVITALVKVGVHRRRNPQVAAEVAPNIQHKRIKTDN